MPNYLYPSFLLARDSGLIDLAHDRFYLMLVTDQYAPDAIHEKRDDVYGEVEGPGYEPGGREIPKTGVSVTEDGASRMIAGDVLWPMSSITARGGVVYQWLLPIDVGIGLSTTRLVCYLDFGADQTSINGPFLVKLSAIPLLETEMAA